MTKEEFDTVKVGDWVVFCDRELIDSLRNGVSYYVPRLGKVTHKRECSLIIQHKDYSTERGFVVVERICMIKGELM